jgi:hypothetical protein
VLIWCLVDPHAEFSSIPQRLTPRARRVGCSSKPVPPAPSAPPQLAFSPRATQHAPWESPRSLVGYHLHQADAAAGPSREGSSPRAPAAAAAPAASASRTMNRVVHVLDRPHADRAGAPPPSERR